MRADRPVEPATEGASPLVLEYGRTVLSMRPAVCAAKRCARAGHQISGKFRKYQFIFVFLIIDGLG